MVLTTLENILIEYLCSDEFEMRMSTITSVFDVMRELEYKLMNYLDLYHKLIEQNAVDEMSNDSKEEQKSGSNTKKYETQADFIKVVQIKICAILSGMRTSVFEKQGFMMNHASTKSLVEFLHAYLSFIAKFSSKIDMTLNK